MTSGAASEHARLPQTRDDAQPEQIAADPQRPQYHFLPSANWLNDPNGLIQWRGVYHMFYQYNPNEPVHRDMHWGHAASTDLVHWTHLPVALAPSPDGPDAAGCWSGCAVDNNGVPTLIYSGNPQRTGRGFQLPCLATGDTELLTWTKYEGNPIIATPPSDLDILEFRDHSVWKEDDTWYHVIGAGIRDVGGAALLFRSKDLRSWEYLHPLATGDAQRTVPHWTGSVWECPDFFPLDDQHVLVVSAWHERKTHYPVYMIGRYEDHRFTPEREGFVDTGSSFYAPQSLRDDQGRRIMFGWLREARPVAAQIEAGWSGVMSLPRVLSIASNGDLGMSPAPELEQLRGKHYQRTNLEVTPAAVSHMDDVNGAQIEIIAEWERGAATTVGLRVRRSPDGDEETLIGYDFAEQRLSVDRTRSSLSSEVERDVQGRTLELAHGEHLRLHVFLDGSVIEIFANGRACLAERIYPTRADSLGVDLFALDGHATLARIDIWEMRSIWTSAS